MLKITDTIVTTDTEGMVVRKRESNIFGRMMTRTADDDESRYEEVSREQAEADLRKANIREVYREEARRLIRERYDESEEFEIQRKALNLLINPEVAALSDDDPEAEAKAAADAEKVIADFAAYNAAVETALAQADADAERIYEERIAKEIAKEAEGFKR